MKSKGLSFYFLYGLLSAVALLPLWLLYLLGDCLTFIAYRLLGYRVDVVRKNLRNSFPEKSERELKTIERDFYRFLGEVIVESVKLTRIRRSNLKRRVRVTNPELVERMAAESPAIILYLGHYCNWEWVPAAILSLHAPRIMGSLYKPLHSAIMDKVMLAIRSRIGIELIPSKTAYRRLLEMKREGESFMIGFIADQRPLGQPLNHWTTFMHQPTAFVTGGETIGTRVGAAFLYLDMRQVKRGFYELTFREMEVSPEDTSEFPYTRLFFRMLEDSIRRAPAFWLWSHNRWKAKPPEDFRG